MGSATNTAGVVAVGDPIPVRRLSLRVYKHPDGTPLVAYLTVRGPTLGDPRADNHVRWRFEGVGHYGDTINVTVFEYGRIRASPEGGWGVWRIDHATDEQTDELGGGDL